MEHIPSSHPSKNYDDSASMLIRRKRTSSADDQERFRRFLALGIPAVTVAILAIYVLVWAAGNANPALRAEPADEQVLQQVIGIPQSVWERVGTGGLTSPWRPVDGQSPLTGSSGRPTLLYIGGEFCEFCATERWAILIALSRFGTFSGLSQLRSYDEQIATFTFYHSAYISPYLDFTPVEYVGNAKDIWGQFVPLQSFQDTQRQIYEKYDTTNYLPVSQGLPFLDLNNQYLLGGGIDPSLFQNAGQAPLSWQEIARALTVPLSPITQHVLGTANYLTAAVCHVTSQRPVNVCDSPIIQGIEQLWNSRSAMLQPR